MREIVGHEVNTASQMGWTTIKNGALLALASQQFDVFVTVDRTLFFQQNLEGLSIAVIVLCAHTNRLADLKPLIPDLVVAIEAASRGTVSVVGPT